MNKLKVLLIYPTLFRITGLPIGLASISAVLRKSGFDVKIFDTAFYDLNNSISEMQIRANLMMSKKIDNEEKYLFNNNSDIKNDILKLIDEYNPQVIGISILEPNYELSLSLTKIIKQKFKNIIIVAGGVFPTLSPEVVFSEDSIDMVCLGEGETPFMELCDKIAKHKDYSGIKGLWIKKNGIIYKNKPTIPNDLNKLPHPDFRGFDSRLFYKPMQGRLYKMINIETSRGCPFQCTYCAAPKLKKFYQESSGSSYYRELKIERALEQIYYQIEKHSPEFIYFSSETFLSLKDADFDEFIKEYRKIKIPFWFQTRFETINEDRIKALKEVGMFWLTIGVEHGNEKYRKKNLKRYYTNEEIMKSASVLKKFDIGASLNNMIGLPFETRALVFDTIKLNKQLWEINNKLEINVFLFTPYKGCELYDICVKNGLLSGDLKFGKSDICDETALNFSEEFKMELKGLMRTFNLYVKLPENFYPKIKVAERPDEEGNKMLKLLAKNQ